MDERTLAPPARAGVNIRASKEPISLPFSLDYDLIMLTPSTLLLSHSGVKCKDD